MSKELKTGREEKKTKYTAPIADIYETESEYIITMDMPGVDKNGIEITLDNNELSIMGTLENPMETENLKHAEYRLYDYRRTFRVGDDINGNSINAVMEDGVLTLNLPKKDEVKPRKIEITVA